MIYIDLNTKVEANFNTLLSAKTGGEQETESSTKSRHDIVSKFLTLVSYVLQHYKDSTAFKISPQSGDQTFKTKDNVRYLRLKPS